MHIHLPCIALDIGKSRYSARTHDGCYRSIVCVALRDYFITIPYAKRAKSKVQCIGPVGDADGIARPHDTRPRFFKVFHLARQDEIPAEKQFIHFRKICFADLRRRCCKITKFYICALFHGFSNTANNCLPLPLHVNKSSKKKSLYAMVARVRSQKPFLLF